MDFADRINQLAAQAPKVLPNIKTEEATKNALIMPFIQALGYDPFNLDEVNPELVADVGIKKGEKVDYAIMRDGKPIMLIECKTAGSNLDSADVSQLFRYFHVTDVRFSILTNGIEYRFFTDLDAPNKMDAKPFLIVNLLDLKETHIEELKKFTKSVFDENLILSTASQLKYTSEIKRLIALQAIDPEDEFVRFFATRVYHGKVTAAVKDQFTILTKQAFRQYVNDQITDRFKSALQGEPIEKPAEPIVDENKIETTPDELEAFFIIRAILREVVDIKRVALRDSQTYCAILLDDNNRRPICRLHFNRAQKYLGLFDLEKREQKIPINSIDDIYQHASTLKATIGLYQKDTSTEQG